MFIQEINTTLLFTLIALGAIFIGVSIVLLFTTFNNKKNKLYSEKLEAALEFQKRLHKSELNALRSQMNPHFVHNSLNAILYYVQRNEVETTEEYLVKFSKLIRLFFDFSRRQFVTLEEEETLLIHYLDIEKLRFEDKFDFTINFDPKIDKEEATIPAMLIQPLVENAINHGIFHSKEKGNISISFSYIDTDSYTIIVEDNGIGYKAAQKLKTNYKDKVRSNSSNVLQERIDLLNLSGQMDISYTLTDLSDTHQGKGTSVSLTLKNKDEHTDV